MKQSTGSHVPPPVAGQVPVKHEKIRSTAPELPRWINEIPGDEGAYHFMVGMSDHFASEKSAREAAMQDARSQYARYTGVEVSEIDEVARFLEGSESDTLDGRVDSRSERTQKTDARVSRIKLKTLYTETFNDSKRGVFSGTSYRTWALVMIPVDEDARVDKWRATKVQNLKISRAELQASAMAELQRLVSGQQNALESIDVALSKGQLMLALSQLQQQEKLLDSELQRFQRGGAGLAAKGPQISALKFKLEAKAQSIQSSLVLDPGRFDGLLLIPARGERSVPVWAWLRVGDGVVPVAELPLVLKNLQDETLSQAITTSSGKATFFIRHELSGPVQIGVDFDSGMIGLLPEKLCNGLARSSCRLNLVSPGNDLSLSVRYGVQELFGGGAHSELIAERILLGPITYAGTGLGGEFTQLVKKQLRHSLKEVRGLLLVEPQRRDVKQVEDAVRTRGIQMNDNQPAPSIGSAAMQALMDGAEAGLEGTYTVQPGGIQIDLSLRQARTDVVLAAVSMHIPLAAVPAGVDLVPPQSGMLNSPGQVQNGAITVEITSQYGNGQTYTEGEVISYFASIDREAYLLMIYADAAGNLLQIFPNSRSENTTFSAGSAIQVPTAKDPFEFEISAPFGREQVFAFASSKAFPDLPGTSHPSGLKVLNVGMSKALNILRNSGNKPGTAYGEAFTVLTTVAKQ